MSSVNSHTVATTDTSPVTSATTPDPSSSGSAIPPSTSTSVPSTATSSPSTTTSAVSSTSSGTSTSTSSSSSSSSSPINLQSSTSVHTTTGLSGGLITVTSVVGITPTGDIAPSQSEPVGSKSFLQNKGAVAGVFTVVGLIAVAILVAFVTNTIRRRRAKKFDREIDEAAREAAAAKPPVFLDDVDNDNDHLYGSGGYGSGGGYSDISSHGTYGQPPRSVGHGQETYNMRELGISAEHDPFGAGGVGAGAAGIGIARARSMRDGGGYAAALAEGQSPYPAFAAPRPVEPPELYNVPTVPAEGALYRGPGGPEYNLLEAAGMGAGGIAAGAAVGGIIRGQSMSNRLTQQTHYPDLSRSKSQGAQSLGGMITASTTEYISPQSESYASHYEPGFRADGHQEPPVDSDAAYAGYAVSHDQRSPSGASGSIGSPGSLPNPFTPSTVHTGATGDEHGSHLDSEEEEEEEEEEEDRGRRVLKVANE